MQDRKDLKIQALLEKISNLTMSYENQVADLRVELTLVNGEIERLQEQSVSQAPDTSSDDAD